MIGEGRDVVERVFDRERLALCIHRDRRDLIQRVHDRRKIALRIIAERRRVVQRSSHSGRRCKVK